LSVFDSSALLALTLREPGSDRVARLLSEEPPSASALNFAEMLGRYRRYGDDWSPALRLVEAFGIDIVPFDARDAEMAAALEPLTRAKGLSLADRACLVLALRRGETAVTADRPWAELPGLGIEIVLIR
jgi:ribonuclease VapC